MWNDPVVKDTLLTSYGSGGPICPAFVRGPWAAGLDDVRNETGPYKSTDRGGSRALVPNLQNLGVRSSNLFGRATSVQELGTPKPPFLGLKRRRACEAIRFSTP